MRIIHLTDLHLRHYLPGTSSIPKRRSRVVLGLLERAVTRLTALQPDLVAVTGDLLDYPLEWDGRGDRNAYRSSHRPAPAP
jgi:predicted MPP superfamily phosphohydrolase